MQKYQVTAAQLLLSWGLHRGCIIIPRSSNIDRLKENADATKVSMEQADVDKIAEINENIRICDANAWIGDGNSIFA